jgi:hypothetical protein
MPAPNPNKTQLNLFVSTAEAELFRELGRRMGYGQRPSPLLGILLKLALGEFKGWLKWLKWLRGQDASLMASREQIFFARELASYLVEWAGAAERAHGQTGD